MEVLELFKRNRIIPAVKSDAAVENAIKSKREAVFLLSGEIATVGDTVSKMNEAGKKVFVHLDLINGFSSDEYAIRYISRFVEPFGLITTRTKLLPVVKKIGLPVIMRVFIVDNLSISTAINNIKQFKPDAVEILPGLMPKVVKLFLKEVSIPIIMGGLVSEHEEAVSGLEAGAISISTSNEALWKGDL